jgi:uncharacterized caspase-like protein
MMSPLLEYIQRWRMTAATEGRAMLRQLLWGLTAAAMTIAVQASPATASPTRVALVIGNAAYEEGPLKTSLNDAGLVAEALNSVGFEVLTGADLDQTELRIAFRDFISKVELAGSDVEAFVYFSGYGVDYDGENYLLPISARLKQIGDIPIEAVRVADFVRPLSGTLAAAKIIAIDAARKLPFPLQGWRVAPGLAASDPQPQVLLGLSSEPGTIAEEGPGSYGPYAMAIAEMLIDPAQELDPAQKYETIFTRIRKRTYRASDGRQIPWHVSALTSEIGHDRASQHPDASGMAQTGHDAADIETAFALAIEADSLSAYVQYARMYPNGPYTARVWAAMRARREALTWLRVMELNQKEGYWTYLARYPDGLHAGDAARRLQRISVPIAAPQGFVQLDLLDVPPPVEGDPSERVASFAQPAPDALIGAPPALFAKLRPPTRPAQPGRLPSPGQIPLAASVHERPPMRPAARIPPPQGMVIAAPGALPSERDYPLRGALGPEISARLGGSAPQSSAQQSPRPDQAASRVQLSRLPSPADSEQVKPLPTVPLPRARPLELLAPSAGLESESDYRLRGVDAGPEASVQSNSAVPQGSAQQSPRPEHPPSGTQLSTLPSPTESDQAKPLLTVPLPRARPREPQAASPAASPPYRPTPPPPAATQPASPWQFWPFGAAQTGRAEPRAP